MVDKYNSKIAKLLAWLHSKHGYAITISSTCTLYSTPESMVHEDWRRHELVHQRQIREQGWWKFMAKYLFYSWKYGYEMHPLEKEARGEK